MQQPNQLCLYFVTKIKILLDVKTLWKDITSLYNRPKHSNQIKVSFNQEMTSLIKIAFIIKMKHKIYLSLISRIVCR